MKSSLKVHACAFGAQSGKYFSSVCKFTGLRINLRSCPRLLSKFVCGILVQGNVEKMEITIAFVKMQIPQCIYTS